MDMGLLKAANSTPVAWVDVEQAPYPTSYDPVMALAQNHIFFLNVPDVPAGSADIYVIHCELGPRLPSIPVPTFNVVDSIQTTTSSLRYKPSQRPAVVGRSPPLMVRPRRSSRLRGCAAFILHSLRTFQRIISAPGTRSIRIYPR